MMISSCLNKVKGYYFFPIIIFELVYLLFCYFHWLEVFFLIFLIVRVFWGKKKEMIIICWLAIILGCCFGLFTVLTLKTSSLKTNPCFILLPDTLKIEGDYLTGEAQEKRTKEKWQLAYVLESKQEKQFFLKNTKALEIKVKGEVQKRVNNTNLNGFNAKVFCQSHKIKGYYRIEQMTSLKKYQVPLCSFVLKLRCCRQYLKVKTMAIKNKEVKQFTEVFILGLKTTDNAEQLQLWKKLGVLHLFSLSGMHLYFFINGFRYFFLRLGLTLELERYFELLFIFILIVLTGFSIGMVRAGMMLAVKELNKQKKWQLSRLDCWSFALFFNSLFSPFLLLTVGGQFSYYLSFIIIMIYPEMQRIKRKQIKSFVFNVLLCFFSLPLIWFYFYEWNILFFGLSFLLAPLLFGVVLPIVTLHFFIVVFFGVDYCSSSGIIIECLNVFSKRLNQWSFAQFTVGKPPILILGILILIQWFLFINYQQRPLDRKRLFIFLSLFFFCSFFKMLNPFGMVAMIDVGQGDSLFIKEPFSHRVFLIDTGGQRSFMLKNWRKKKQARCPANYTVIPFLKSQGVKKIDAIFISHAHEDHCGDLKAILNEFEVDAVVSNQGTSQNLSFQKLIKTYPTQQQVIWRTGSNYNDRYLKMDCLYPSDVGDGGNNDSLVLKIKMGTNTLLCMGDIERIGEEKILSSSKRQELKCDILKIGHHGSQTSSHQSFIKAVAPSVGLISCGANNKYGHPSQVTIKKLKQEKVSFYRTDVQGMLYSYWLPNLQQKMKFKSIK